MILPKPFVDANPESAAAFDRHDAPMKSAGALLSFAPAAFSLDLRIHNIMLAVADELADEQRTINEPLLLRQFAPQMRRT